MKLEAGASTEVEAGKLKVSVSADRLEFQTDGLRLSGAAPGVTLLIGSEEREIELRARGLEGVSEDRHARDFLQEESRIGPFAEQRLTHRSTPAGEAHDMTWCWADSRGYRFSWTVSFLPHLSAFTLRAGFTNGSDEPVRLREFTLCRTGDGALVCEGEPSQWLLSSLEHNSRIGHLGQTMNSSNEEMERIWAGFRLPVPFELPADERYTDGSWRVYPDYLTLYTDAGRKGIACGPVGAPEADVRFECKVNDGTMRLDIISDMSGVIVEPGESRNSQEVAIIAGPCDPAVEALLRWTAATHGSRTHRGAAACWNSWYEMHGRITEQSIRENADGFKLWRERLPLQVIQIDDGYQRSPGDWRCNDKFPGGLGPLAEYIRNAGAEPGIWLAPLAVHDSLGILDEHPDWFQRNRAGHLEGEANNWGPKSHWLDPTHPDVQTFLRGIIRMMQAEGFTYFKIDFNIIGSNCRFHNPKKTRLQAFRDLYRLYREEMGESAYLVACSQFIRGVFGTADSVRIGPDSPAIWETLHNCSIIESIRAIGMNAASNGILFANDPDTTYAIIPKFDNAVSITPDELRTWHGFVGLLGGTVQFSDRMYHSDFGLNIRALEILLPPAPDRARSLQAGADPEHRRFGFMARRPWGAFASVLLWNPETEEQGIELQNHLPQNTESVCQAASFFSPLGARFHAWSFWNERYIGIVDERFRTDPLLPRHSQLLRFTGLSVDEEIPVLVGTNLHISMGSAEISDIAATRNRFVVTLNGDAGARDGKLFVFSKRQLELASAEGCDFAEVSEQAEHIWIIKLAGRKRGQAQLLELRVRI